MANLVENETVKLIANWLNGMSIALVGAGIFVPLVNQLVGNNAWAPEQLALLLISCVIVAAILHLSGQKVLRGLHEADT